MEKLRTVWLSQMDAMLGLHVLKQIGNMGEYGKNIERAFKRNSQNRFDHMNALVFLQGEECIGFAFYTKKDKFMEVHHIYAKEEASRKVFEAEVFRANRKLVNADFIVKDSSGRGKKIDPEERVRILENLLIQEGENLEAKHPDDRRTIRTERFTLGPGESIEFGKGPPKKRKRRPGK